MHVRYELCGWWLLLLLWFSGLGRYLKIVKKKAIVDFCLKYTCLLVCVCVCVCGWVSCEHKKLVLCDINVAITQNKIIVITVHCYIYLNCGMLHLNHCVESPQILPPDMGLFVYGFASFKVSLHSSHIVCVCERESVKLGEEI